MKNEKPVSFRIKKFDIFAYNPNYEWTSYKTNLGSIMSYLTVGFLIFYIGVTTRDYIFRPPELVSAGDIDLLTVEREIPFQLPKIGLRLSYNNGTQISLASRIMIGEDNRDPYFRFEFNHVTVTDQDSVPRDIRPLQVEDCIVSNLASLCPIQGEEYNLQGTFFKSSYQFVQLQAFKCLNFPWCAPIEEIDAKIQSGDFRAQVGIEAENFDVALFHTTGTGAAMSNRSWEWYAIPNIELNTDIFLQPREIEKEDRYLGSPPIPETTVRVLSFHRRETNLRPRSAAEPDLLSWNVRLSDSVLLQEVSYWSPSILDLFGVWGAMASFLTSLSLGFVAFNYNRYHFHLYFERAARKQRKEAKRKTLASMQALSRKTKGDRESYDNLRSQYDALMIEPDIRLFEEHHFGPDGRVNVTAEELKFPTTAFGELRRIAIEQHMMKKRAARLLSLWWGHILVRRGFITDNKRKHELFEFHPDESSKRTNLRNDLNDKHRDVGSFRPNMQWVRQRFGMNYQSTSGRIEETTLKTKAKKQRLATLEESEEGRRNSLIHIDQRPSDDEASPAPSLWTSNVTSFSGESVASNSNIESGVATRRSSSFSLTEDGEILRSPSKMKQMIGELDIMATPLAKGAKKF